MKEFRHCICNFHCCVDRKCFRKRTFDLRELTFNPILPRRICWCPDKFYVINIEPIVGCLHIGGAKSYLNPDKFAGLTDIVFVTVSIFLIPHYDVCTGESIPIWRVIQTWNHSLRLYFYVSLRRPVGRYCCVPGKWFSPRKKREQTLAHENSCHQKPNLWTQFDYPGLSLFQPPIYCPFK